MGGVYAGGRGVAAGRDACHTRPGDPLTPGKPGRYKGRDLGASPASCVPAGYARTIESPSTLTDLSGSGDLAGPAVTAPSAIANLLP